MSTRSQIEFQVKYKQKNGKYQIDRRTVYRHSDGYPKGVGPDLEEFLKWNAGRNTDIEYLAANFIYWSKRKYADMSEQWAKDRGEKNIPKWDAIGDTNCSANHIGFGICENDDFHGDIEYFYVVEIEAENDREVFNNGENINIYVYDHGVKLKDRTKERKVTIKDYLLLKEMGEKVV